MLDQDFLEQHLNRSKALDVSDIDWADVPNHALRDDEIRVLTYMMDVESNTIVYLKELLSTPAIHDPKIQAFLSCWAYEEYFHGHALRRFLAAYGIPLAERRTEDNQQRKSLWNHLFVLGQTLLARWAGERFIGVHMAWGATNELSTAEAYLRLYKKTQHPILKDLIHRIMKDERRHFAFYYHEAQRRLQDPQTARLTGTLIRRFFDPVGADIRSRDEVDAVALMVFGDEEGLEVVRGLDRKMAALPGMEGFQGMEHALERSRARFGKRLGVVGGAPLLEANA